MPKLKPGTVVPTPEEDAIIRRAIDSDPDTMEFGSEEAARAKRMGSARDQRSETLGDDSL